MCKNIDIISSELPDFMVYIYYGSDITADQVDHMRGKGANVVLIPTNKVGAVNMLYRMAPIDDDNVEVFFSRDADSRVNGRDIWCMKRFIESDRTAHCIRDNFWHKSKLMGGTIGFKVNALANLDDIRRELERYKGLQDASYGFDESFLSDRVYPLVKSQLLLHTSITAFEGEEYRLVDYENDDTNFVGNVIEFGDDGSEIPKFRYSDFNVKEHVNWLTSQKQFTLASHVGKTTRWHPVTDTLDALYIANYYADDLNECRRLVGLYEYTSITDHVVNNVDHLFTLLRKHGYSIVATTDLSHEPCDNEVMVYYGSFPLTHDSFPYKNKVYRNAGHFNRIHHDRVISDACWDGLGQIYILNLEERNDRYIETMCELCKVNAPLDRVFHYKAKKTSGDNGPYVGATQNHIDAMRHMTDNHYKTALVLEDDIVFSSEVARVKQDVAEFFSHGYDYDICFLSASRFHAREPYNDLLILSKQTCTTSSAYFLSRDTVERVLSCVEEGMGNLKDGGDPNKYCIDRYWAKLQADNKVFIFKKKIAYQRPNYSNIKGTVAAYLD